MSFEGSEKPECGLFGLSFWEMIHLMPTALQDCPLELPGFDATGIKSTDVQDVSHSVGAVHPGTLERGQRRARLFFGWSALALIEGAL